MGEYVYTADGERLLRTEGGSTTLFLPGGQEVTLAGSALTAKRYYSFEAYDVAAADNLGEAAIAATGFIPAGGGASVRLARSALESRRLALRRAGMYNESRRFEHHRNNMRDLDPIGNVMDEGALLISTHAYGGNMVDRFTSEASP